MYLYILKSRENSGPVCLTTPCIVAAAKIIQNLDETVDPCSDFYQFACGRFPKNNILPDSQVSISSVDGIGDMLKQQLRSLFEEPVQKKDIRPFVLVKSVYQACMNISRIQEQAVPTLKNIITSLGGWPVLEGDTWNEDAFNWETTSEKFQQVGFDTDSIFFSLTVETDPRNSKKTVVELDQPNTVAFDKLMRNGFVEPVVQAYYHYMVQYVTALGAEEGLARIEMKDVINMNIEIIRSTAPPEDLRNTTLTTNPMKIQELHDRYNYASWIKYINYMIQPAARRMYHEEVIVTVPKYFQKLKSIIQAYPKRTLANYMFWYGVSGLTHSLDQNFRNLELEFSKIASGVSQLEPRWQECTVVASSLNIAASALYVRNIFNKEAKATVTEMVNNIRYQFSDVVQNLDWMDAKTKHYALQKIKAMEAHVAYPEELLSDEKIDEYYKDLELHSHNYLEATLNFTRFTSRVQNLKLDKVVNRTDWREHADCTDVNAYYGLNDNSIEITASILQGIFFSNDRPQYMNYGAIGHVIGHEITHGFDDVGSQFDKNGNLYNWWQPKTRTAFDEKTRCIVDQYSKFRVPYINLNLNGANSEGENIADNGGVKQAYLAYKKWSMDYGTEQGLPGLPYSPEQLFWISLGNAYCNLVRPEELKIRVLGGDSHSPNYFRVNVPLMNSEFFAKDFECSEGSKMNPEEKCTIW